MKRLVADGKADRKVRLFTHLTRLAVSSDIALILEWWRLRDPLNGIWEVQCQSLGPPGTPCACVFCGRNLLSAKSVRELGQFRAHRKCVDDAFENWEEVCFLPPNSYRPAVVFVTSTCPGSIDNVNMRVAWGIGMHSWLLRRPSASLESLDREAQSYGMALVSRFLEAEEELVKLSSSAID